MPTSRRQAAGLGCTIWQYRQIVDAIQKLFELVGVGWLERVDWDNWRDSARSLPGSHPTVARDYNAVVPATETALAPTIPFADVRQAHGPLLDQVHTAVRRRGYAIKTEQTYLH